MNYDWQVIAFKKTIELVEKNSVSFIDKPGFSLEHLKDMLDRIEKEKFGRAKLGRWLGWAQAVAVASGAGNLEDFKKLNKNIKSR